MTFKHPRRQVAVLRRALLTLLSTCCTKTYPELAKEPIYRQKVLTSFFTIFNIFFCLSVSNSLIERKLWEQFSPSTSRKIDSVPPRLIFLTIWIGFLLSVLQVQSDIILKKEIKKKVFFKSVPIASIPTGSACTSKLWPAGLQQSFSAPALSSCWP